MLTMLPCKSAYQPSGHGFRLGTLQRDVGMEHFLRAIKVGSGFWNGGVSRVLDPYGS